MLRFFKSLHHQIVFVSIISDLVHKTFPRKSLLIARYFHTKQKLFDLAWVAFMLLMHYLLRLKLFHLLAVFIIGILKKTPRIGLPLAWIFSCKAQSIK